MALINTTTTGILGTTVYGDGAGALTVQKDGVTQGIYGNIPGFRAYLPTTQTLTLGTWTKVTLSLENFDTNNNFDISNYRFTPTIAGYYHVNWTAFVDYNVTQFTQGHTAIYKNGSVNTYSLCYSASSYGQRTITDLILMNGTTDYLEFYVNISGGSGPQIGGGTTYTHASAFLAKAI